MDIKVKWNIVKLLLSAKTLLFKHYEGQILSLGYLTL